MGLVIQRGVTGLDSVFWGLGFIGGFTHLPEEILHADYPGADTRVIVFRLNSETEAVQNTRARSVAS